MVRMGNDETKCRNYLHVPKTEIRAHVSLDDEEDIKRTPLVCPNQTTL